MPKCGDEFWLPNPIPQSSTIQLVLRTLPSAVCNRTELRADAIRVLDRHSEPSDAAEPPVEDQAPY